MYYCRPGGGRQSPFAALNTPIISMCLMLRHRGAGLKRQTRSNQMLLSQSTPHPLRWICSHTHAAHNIYAVSYLWRSHSSSQPESEMKLPRINSRAPSHYTERPLCRHHTISDFHDGFVNRKCGRGLKCKQFGDVLRIPYNIYSHIIHGQFWTLCV